MILSFLSRKTRKIVGPGCYLKARKSDNQFYQMPSYWDVDDRQAGAPCGILTDVCTASGKSESQASLGWEKVQADDDIDKVNDMQI